MPLSLLRVIATDLQATLESQLSHAALLVAYITERRGEPNATESLTEILRQLHELRTLNNMTSEILESAEAVASRSFDPNDPDLEK